VKNKRIDECRIGIEATWRDIKRKKKKESEDVTGFPRLDHTEGRSERAPLASRARPNKLS
jgi:hypothetical protein